MSTEIEEQATLILLKAVKHWVENGSRSSHHINSDVIAALTDLEPPIINIAADLLESAGYVELTKYMGSHPFKFSALQPTPRGILESQKILSEEEQNSENPEQKNEIKSKQKEIQSIINEHDDFQFSVFISHANRDYPLLHDLCCELLENNIEPVLWFKEVKDEIVMNKLCKMIDRSDLFLIHMSPNSVDSQMTNNEIGFIEGKKYYTQEGADIVLRLFDKNIKPEDFKGFYNKGFDGFDNCDPTSKEDREEVIHRLHEMWDSIEKTETSSDTALNEEALIDMIPKIIQFFYAHENYHLNFPKARFICEKIKKESNRSETTDPRDWYKIYDLVFWINAIHAEIFDDFKMKLESYLKILNKEIGGGFKL